MKGRGVGVLCVDWLVGQVGVRGVGAAVEE